MDDFPMLIARHNNQEILNWLLTLYGENEHAFHRPDIMNTAISEGLANFYKSEDGQHFYSLTLKGLWYIKLMLKFEKPRPYTFWLHTYMDPKHFIETVDKRNQQILNGVPDDKLIGL